MAFPENEENMTVPQEPEKEEAVGIPEFCSEDPQQEAAPTEEPKEYAQTQQDEASLEKENTPELPRSGRKSFWRCFLKACFAVLIAVMLVLISSIVTAFFIDQQWQKEKMLLNEVTQNRIDVLMERIEAMESGSTENDASAQLTDRMTPAQVYQRNVQAVVAVTAKTVSTNSYGQQAESGSSGSGFIISADGYVVTNFHVVENATAVAVVTFDGNQHEARIIGYDSTNDIAVLKVEGENLPHVTLGSSDAMIVGDQVVAIGNPLGTLSSTLTVGFVSAKDRIVSTTGIGINMLQTDAAINSGNSGGPLFNMAGEVVGITTAKYSGYTASGAAIEGIGFAIPMDDVVDMILDLQQYGYITGAYLGVTVRDVNAAVAAEYGLPLGTRVEEVVPGVCADRAGILPGDIIIDLGGYEITNISDLSRALRKLEPGQKTTITVFRSGMKVNLRILLDEKPPEMSTG